MNLARKIANEFGRGIAAGFIISFGAPVYLMMDNKIVASFLFCFGLFIVSEFDLNLYTGRIGYLATERTGAYLRYVAFGTGRKLCRYVNFSLYFAANKACK